MMSEFSPTSAKSFTSCPASSLPFTVALLSNHNQYPCLPCNKSKGEVVPLIDFCCIHISVFNFSTVALISNEIQPLIESVSPKPGQGVLPTMNLYLAEQDNL
jgi:hypothetical protein